MFGKLGTSELIVILVIALVIFGPAKLPEIGKMFGQAIGEFKTHMKKTSEDVQLDDK
ncbi:twin-arginine translocase TatA/TatE family subunit [Alkaliphilus sp. MSJ-5]|uniref:Twin-arginine translocase TatA/TatE family subunit n=1 Tax=Alkaliphilus flagellatus TaxID=2841507 RepID=A0ABS6G6T3_9FIRM|nr:MULTISPECIES: twin-arginine translocase TatA/TatE family subunit [Alkaliphilus]MBU5678063.1 twin-arginine translocase TatA/TatE family subunit [Alkaliphilus flagellatus]QUH19982.1 twin-arginine translocase TatA/TatE family subunit [Alkaliphilus sp. B6464]